MTNGLLYFYTNVRFRHELDVDRKPELLDKSHEELQNACDEITYQWVNKLVNLDQTNSWAKLNVLSISHDIQDWS